MKKALLAGVALLILISVDTLSRSAQSPAQSNALRFEITMRGGLVDAPQDGRLFVIMSRAARPEPRLLVGETGLDSPPIVARDVKGFAPGVAQTLDRSAATFPLESLDRIAPGDYIVQAVFDSNIDLKSVNAPGNLYSDPAQARIDPSRPQAIRLELKHRVPAEELPADSELVRFVKIQSDLLSKFHGRPIYLRAGVILPRGFNDEPARRYPLRVHIGGYGERYTSVRRMMNQGSPFRAAWMADDAPRMILLHLDGDGPFGDSYQVNSANNGPFGDAITRELIPHVEKKFRAVGEPRARVLDGGSTGGWVALALQVFYPDFFNGVWSAFPDPVDFRQLQLINIYEDLNAYVNRHGFERPSARDLNGDVRFTIRHECQMENVLGAGDSWSMSGQQWGAWNAAYGPRGVDGRPVALWDPKSGAINREVIEHWRQYDLRLVLERNWQALAPRLRGKITIWVGEADDYFLNNAVHLLDQFLSKATPAYEGRIIYGAGKGHGWMALSERQMLQEMAAAIEKRDN
ncbi:MAG TPA: alpha/beta hydrolase-fold protein [Blastocatellia bacterium]|jgi:hypothetical protein